MKLKKILLVLTSIAVIFSSNPVFGEDLFSSGDAAFSTEQEAPVMFEEEQEASAIFDEGQEQSEEFTEGQIAEEEFDDFSAEEEGFETFSSEEFSEEISMDAMQNLAGSIDETEVRETVEEAYPAGSGTSGVRTTCTVYSGDNLELQNYGNTSRPVYSFLENVGDGKIMRVQSGAIESKILIEYYDTSYNLLSTKKVNMELPIWGGFYAYGNYYYVLTGQANEAESDSREVLRLTKYNKSWKKISSASVYGANTYCPFSGGSARMTASGSKLFIHTCHTMYTSYDGRNHQANMKVSVDVNSMQVIDKNYEVSWIYDGYVSHSFNQFSKIDGNNLVSVDHGDGYPRGIALCITENAANTGKVSTIDKYKILHTFPGEIGNNYTGGTIGGFEISSSSYLVAGNNINGNMNIDRERDVYIDVCNKETGSVSRTYLTNYKGKDISARTPHLVSVGSDRFLILWSTDDKVRYTLLDGKGKRISNFYCIDGNLSDCAPIVMNGKVVWYTWSENINVFYEIPVNTLKAKSTVIENGHKYSVQGTVKNGQATVVCNLCGHKKTGAVPTSMDIYMDRNGQLQAGINTNLSNKEAFNGIVYTYTSSSSQEKLDDLEIIVSNPSVLRFKIVADYYSNHYYLLEVLKPGRTKLTIRAKYNPSVSITKTITINMLDQCTMSISNSSYTYNGKERKPTVTIKKSNKTLKAGVDYTVSYSNNIKAGTATVTAKGIGNYAGTISKKFTIKLPASKITSCTNVSNGVSLKWEKVNGASGYYIYRKAGTNGSYASIAKISNNTTFAYTDTTAKPGICYSYYVKAFYKKATSNSKSVITYFIKAPGIASLKNSASKSASIKWNKLPYGVQYQIQYSTSSRFSKVKTISAISNSQVVKQIKGLEKGKKYYFRVRGYSRISGQTCFSAWSKTKSVLIKK